MRILFLTKRRYMGHDVIVDRYARMYQLPYQLARLGHAVQGCCLSYSRTKQGRWSHEAAPGSLEWRSWNLQRTVLPSLLWFRHQVLAAAYAFQPDIIIGASDIPHCMLARHLAGILRIPYALDFYDNFESYGQARIPGAVAGLRWAARGAALISCVSRPLADYVQTRYRVRGHVHVLESTVDKALFHPADRQACRARLGLPPHARLIGTAGALSVDKGICTLYQAFEQLASQDPQLHLVLAGPVDPGTPPPSGSRVHLLGQLPHAAVAELFAALDVAVICIRDTPFGRYCFPQKAYEMLACGVPVVAADIGAMSTLLKPFPATLYRPDDAASLATQLARQLQAPSPAKVPIKDWAKLAGELEQGLLQAIQAS